MNNTWESMLNYYSHAGYYGICRMYGSLYAIDIFRHHHPKFPKGKLWEDILYGCFRRWSYSKIGRRLFQKRIKN
jgi:hypothetical protein